MHQRTFPSRRLSSLLFLVALAVCLLPIATAYAQPPGVIFTDGFESGDLCVWSIGAIRIGGVAPAEGAVGTEIAITGLGFGSRVQDVFLSRDSVDAALEVIDFSDDRILARLGEAIPAGVYDVRVVGCNLADTALAPDGFEVRLPADLAFAPTFVAGGTEVTLTGSFLGSQEGQIAITSKRDPMAGALGASIVSWQQGPGGAPDEVVFVVPPNLPANGFYDVVVTNGAGSVTRVDALVGIGVADGDTEDLRVVSAVATSNTEVLLQFSEAVQGGMGGAENPAHYSISAQIAPGLAASPEKLTALPQEPAAAILRPEGGPPPTGRSPLGYGQPGAKTAVVGVLQAEVLRPDLSTVRLTTLSQSGLLYTLRVTNVRDLAGNTIAPPEILVDPSKTTFVGMPPGSGEVVDSDGDGLSDSDEQRGWIVSVERADGGTETRHVNSDPGDPRLDVDDPINVAARDTDDDGVNDNEEKNGGMDPRSADTDGDVLTDNEEWNVIFSNPADQDSDEDGVQDGFEFFSFRSSPILADTDGDALSDTDEILGRNRDPRIADLPRAAIRVGEVRLQIDERFTFENAQGSTVTVESSSSSTLSQSENTTFATSDTDVTEHVASARLETGFEGPGGRGTVFLNGAFINIEGSYQFTDSSTFQTDRTSAIESQRVHELSLRKAQEFTTTSTVTREIFGAGIDVDLTIQNAGDIAFAISNLEITVLQRSRESTSRFLPVATLIANSTIITGEPATFNLGPFTPERGPILFSSRDVFPKLVEELMRSPSGLIFKVANFDMTDELGRIFTFSNQTARDRTAGVIVDFGDGQVERHLVATSLQPDPDGFATGSIVGGFNADGSPIGIPLDFALQDILELTKNAAEEDGIVAGANQQADSIAAGDDVQLIPPGTTGVGVGSIVVSAGQNGVLDSAPSGDDQAEVTTGYETSLTCSPESANAREICDEDADCSGGTCTGPEILVRFGSQRTGDFNRVWVVFTTRDIPAGADFGTVVLKPGEDIFFAFVQDLDDDGLFAQEEYMSGSTDSRADVFDNALFGENFDPEAAASQIPDGIPDSKDTDRDGLGDFAEVRLGWRVSNDGGPLRKVLSSPRLRDSDGDGLLDPVEMDLRAFCRPADPRGDALCTFQQEPPVAREDAIAIVAGADGVADTAAAGGDEQLIPQGTSGLPFGAPVVGPGDVEGIQTLLAGDDVYESPTGIPPASDPGLGDTDSDEISDSAEVTGFEIGLSIRDGGNGIAETRANGDDIQKAFQGNPVKPLGIVILPGPNGTIDSAPAGDDTLVPGQTVETDPLRRDTDNDLVSDGRELSQGADPTDPLDGEDFRDSDLDGLSDSEETDLGWVVFVNGISIGVVNPNPSLPDTDFDGLPDFAERDLRTNPNDPDTDGDGLRDFDEFADFERFLGLEEQFPRFFIDGSSSEQYGTDPRDEDSDNDGLTDFDELLTGYRVLLAGEQEFRQIFTNPLAVDTDFDGRTDSQEQNRNPPTDATDPDTDDDGRTDGQEASAGSDPLVPDLAVEITMQRVIGSKVTGDGANDLAEMTWWFTTQGPGDVNPVLLTAPWDARPRNLDSAGNPVSFFWDFGAGGPTTCQVYAMQQGFVTSLSVVSSSRIIVLREGQSFALNGLIGEIDSVSLDCGVPPYYIPSFIRDAQDGCVDTFSEIFTYNDFIGGTTGQLLTAGIQGVCEFEVQYSIEVR